MIQETNPATIPATSPCEAATKPLKRALSSVTTPATTPATEGDEKRIIIKRIQAALRNLREKKKKLDSPYIHG